MAKLTEKDRASIIKEYAAGKSVRELAKKFTVSPTAISKILKSVKSLQNEGKSLQKSLQPKQDNQALAQMIIDKAVAGLVKDIEKASVKDKLQAIERLSALYGIEENKDGKIEFVFEVRDLTRERDESSGDDT
jgi:transposase-like protein